MDSSSSTLYNKASKSEEDDQKRRHSDVRDMVMTLTHKLTQLQSTTKHGSSHHTHNVGGDDEHGIGLITLAGNNTGATMRADLSDKFSADQEMPGAYANSNYQAINNSIMMEGSYSAHDPGVHIVISDYEEEHGHPMKGKGKHKEKKKEKPVDVAHEKNSDGEE